jgi:hypothetical protein
MEASDDSRQRNAAFRSALALGKLERALHGHAKRSIEPSSGGLFKWLKEGNELNFTPEKKKKITGEYGSHSAANKGGRPKKGPWCRFMAVEAAASLGIKEGKNLPSNTRAPGICDITRTRARASKEEQQYGPGRAATAVEQARGRVSFFVIAKPRKRRKKHGANSETQS